MHKLYNVDGKGVSKVIYLDTEIIEFIEKHKGTQSFSSAVRNILKEFIHEQKLKKALKGPIPH